MPYEQYYPTNANYYEEYPTSYTYQPSPPGNYSTNGYEMAPNLSSTSGSSFDSSNSGYPYGSQVPSLHYVSASSQDGHYPQSEQATTTYNPGSPGSPTSYAHGGMDGHMEIPRTKTKQIYPCLVPDCDTKANFKRLADLERHMKTVHFPEPIDCPHGWCGRVGEHGFTRKDHLTDHLREVHMQDIPKASRSTQKGKGSRKDKR